MDENLDLGISFDLPKNQLTWTMRMDWGGAY